MSTDQTQYLEERVSPPSLAQTVSPAQRQAPGHDDALIERPRAIERAVTLMRGGALLAVANTALFFATRDTARQAFEARGVAPQDLDSAVASATGFALVAGFVGVVLWIWMAHLNGAGKLWARVTASVFFAMSVISTAYTLTQPGLLVSKVWAVFAMAYGACIIYLLYRPASTRWYRRANDSAVAD